MDTESEAKRKLLTLIDGGKAQGEAQGGKVKAGPVGKAASGLTLKQEAFAQELAKGATNAEAYRAAYNCDGMAQTTIWQEGCKLAQHPKVAARVEAIVLEKRAKEQLVAAKTSERVNAKAWAMIDNPDTPPAVVANLLNLQAKINGMLTDKIEVKTDAPAADLEAELRARLARYVSD
jgi:hypothetical protein